LTTRRLFVLIVSVLVILVVGLVVAFSIIQRATKPSVLIAADNFMIALKERRFDVAYNMLTPETRAYVSERELQFIFAHPEQLTDWKLYLVPYSENESKVTGKAHSSDLDRPLKVELWFVKRNQEWLVYFYSFSLDMASTSLP
jgi:phenylalanine-4-hydroxylase